MKISVFLNIGMLSYNMNDKLISLLQFFSAKIFIFNCKVFVLPVLKFTWLLYYTINLKLRCINYIVLFVDFRPK